MNKKVKYLFIIIGIILLLFGIIFILKNNNKEQNKNTNEEINEKIYPFNGVFKNENKVIYMYQCDENNAFVSSKDGNIKMRLMIDAKAENIAKGYLDIDECNFEINDEILKIETNNDRLQNGDYKKESSISAEEFFEVLIGKTDYFNEKKYNGLYKLENSNLYMFQYSNDEVYVIIDSDKGSYMNKAYISDENNLFMGDFSSNYQIVLDKDSLTFIIVSKNEMSTSSDDIFDGLYTKVKEITPLDVISIPGIYM